MYQFISNLPKQRLPWVLLALTGMGLEASALFFQYVMELSPCVLCVYERVTIMGIILAGLVGAIAPANPFIRFSGFALWFISAIYSLRISMEHVDIQLNPSPFSTCDFFPNFPSWAPIHEWAPWMFNPTGFCDEISWQFLSYTMPQWLIVTSVIYLAVAVIVFSCHIIGLIKPTK
ncbi:disulfide bond formation protein DsbB [Moritella sp. F3]|uniref:disulfide bond formation protein DsbB n=1 Tax=Moritella sp. F3 TaxID=2718882 RepID=UPI0018E14D00|nr:disulfide bond formation protein DsbB [Moritella sp. F3]GIC78518.1 disulfide bond formation protein B [Moritella sp. F1]GIC81301.1 disulfide bond formation protein B [Moritella sp. F3]